MASSITHKKIIVGSQNPVKINAALTGFQRMFPAISFEAAGVPAPSQVSNQPKNENETLMGANNRAALISTTYPDADFWIGIEGGIQELSEELLAFAWIVIRSSDFYGKGRTASFTLPPAVTHLIREGKELGEADDIVFKRSNSKQDNGAVGILTGNVIDRHKLYEQAVILALIPFKHPDLYCSINAATQRNQLQNDRADHSK
jgi:inosine/xanthosine triphosphatase